MKSMVRVALLTVVLLLMAGCGQMGDRSDPEEGIAAGQTDSMQQASDADCGSAESIEISARDTTFDKECLAAPADKPFEVTFNNMDAFGHSFSVYEQEGGQQLFRGDIFSGPKVLGNKIPALEARSYHFQCDVHPFPMQGVLKVG